MFLGKEKQEKSQKGRKTCTFEAEHEQILKISKMLNLFLDKSLVF
jgi:hypothetical protein